MSTSITFHCLVKFCFQDSPYIAQAGLELEIFPSKPPLCYNYRDAPTYMALIFCMF